MNRGKPGAVLESIFSDTPQTFREYYSFQTLAAEESTVTDILQSLRKIHGGDISPPGKNIVPYGNDALRDINFFSAAAAPQKLVPADNKAAFPCLGFLNIFTAQFKCGSSYKRLAALTAQSGAAVLADGEHESADRALNFRHISIILLESAALALTEQTKLSAAFWAEIL